MKEEMLRYYKEELSYLNTAGKDFAKDFPTIAGRLLLEAGKSADPHVERLLQGFALLSGRVHHKIDQEFPEITEALLGLLYPHFLAPVPAMAIAQFEIGPDQTSSHTIGQGDRLFTRAISSKYPSCQFRACYPATVWPIRVSEAQVRPGAVFQTSSDIAAVIRLKIDTLGRNSFSKLRIPSLRFFLHGDGEVVHTLYELLMNNVREVRVRWAWTDEKTKRRLFTEVCLPASTVHPVGFERGEEILPYPARSFVGYRLVQEYFSFPSKFLFADIDIPPSAPEKACEMELLVHIGSFERADRLQRLALDVKADHFVLGCSPVVNLFDSLAEPIRPKATEYEHRVIPDANIRPENIEVYSVNRVSTPSTNLEKGIEYEPLYSQRHRYDSERSRIYWHTARRDSPQTDDSGTEMFLSLVNLDGKPLSPDVESLDVQVTCSNRDLPGDLWRNNLFGELNLESGGLVRSRCLVPPTQTLRPKRHRSLQWRLISHLSLNYQSIVEGGADALREVLRIYDYAASSATIGHIDGIKTVSSEPHFARVTSRSGIAFVRGSRVTIDFDEQQFVGSGVYLFASVLEKFLGLYTSINSFSQMTAKSQQRERAIRQWQPRSGEQILL